MSKLKTIKIKLNPTPGQTIKMRLWGEYSRDFYDHALNYLMKCYREAANKQVLAWESELDIMSEDELIAQYRSNQMFRSIYSTCPPSVCDGAIRKAYRDVWLFNKGKYMFMPKCSYSRKGLGKTKLSFLIFPRDLRLTENGVFVHDLGEVRLAEKDRIPKGIRYKTPMFVFDGTNWHITVKTSVNDSQDAPNECNKPYIELTDTAFINLALEFDRLGNFQEVCDRKTIGSINWHKAMNRLRGHAGRVANMILDIEHKYNCTRVEFHIEDMKGEVRMKLYT